MEMLVPIALFAAIAFILVDITRTIAEARTRRRLIESGASPELIGALNIRQQSGLSAALQWGLVLAAVGVALIIVDFVDYQRHQPLAIGIVVLSGAVGLLAYFVIARRMASAIDHPPRMTVP
jgi:hypothetical protein